MKPSVNCINLIKESEGLRMTSYLCPANKWTIGYGTTGVDIVKGLTWTKEKAEARFALDLDKFARKVEAMLTAPTKQGQFDALVSFAYNLGLGALQGSTLLRLHNEGKYTAASLQFVRWNKAKVKGFLTELPGLTKRRKAETALYVS